MPHQTLPLVLAALQIVTSNGSTKLTLLDMKSKLKSQVVEVYDPAYGTIKTFDAFPLVDVLTQGGVAPDETADELVFTARDGYSPNVSYNELKKHEAFLAYGEHGKPSGHFEKVTQGKAKVDPGPFLVAWKEGKPLAESVPWPYALVKVELVRFETKYPKMFPKDAADGSAPKKGFAIFKAECVRCHSINLEGGDVGPELNVPKNVLEYWNKDTLKAYIHDVSSFRAHDKMPPFPNLSAGQIDDVVAYLEYMKDHKQPAGGAEAQ